MGGCPACVEAPTAPPRPSHNVRPTLFHSSRPLTLTLGAIRFNGDWHSRVRLGRSRPRGLSRNTSHTHTQGRCAHHSFHARPTSCCCFGEMRAIRAGTAQGSGGREGGPADEAFEAIRFVKKKLLVMLMLFCVFVCSHFFFGFYADVQCHECDVSSCVVVVPGRGEEAQEGRLTPACACGSPGAAGARRAGARGTPRRTCGAPAARRPRAAGPGPCTAGCSSTCGTGCTT